MTNSSSLKRLLPGRPGRLTIAVALLGFVVVLGFAVFAAWLLHDDDLRRRERSVVKAELRSPDRLVLIVHSCNGDPEVTLLQETDVDVRVKVVASSTRDECLDPIEVQLQEPLGDRVVIDKHTGQSVSVSRVY